MRTGGFGRAGVAGAVLVAALLVAGGCSNDSDTTGSTSSTKASGTSSSSVPLQATDWVLSDGSTLAADTDATVTAHFAGGTLAGNSGCNQYRTQYRVDGPKLRIGPDIAGTQMACPPGPTAVERAYRARLPRVREYSIDEDVLKLADAAGRVVLTFATATGTQSVLGDWEVTGYYSGTAVQSPASGSTLSASFVADSVSGDSGCNRFNGPYSTQRDAITIGPLMGTLKACTEETLNTQEQQYLAALQAARTYSVTGNRLDLLRGDGGIAVSFLRAGTTG